VAAAVGAGVAALLARAGFDLADDRTRSGGARRGGSVWVIQLVLRFLVRSHAWRLILPAPARAGAKRLVAAAGAAVGS
jgi:hypothetical protein